MGHRPKGLLSSASSWGEGARFHDSHIRASEEDREPFSHDYQTADQIRLRL
jgi:hypothetical protein